MAYPTKSGSEFLINSLTNADQTHSSITALPDGRFIVTWIDQSQTGGDNSGRAIRAQIFNADGGPSGDEFLVNTAITNDQSFPDVTTLSDGRLVITWSDNSGSVDDASGSAIRGQVFDLDGTRNGDEFLVNTITNANQFTPSVSALGDGGFVIAWSDNSQSSGDTSGSAIRAQMFNADASTQGGEFLVNSSTNNTQVGSAIAGLASGGYVIAWSDSSAASGDRSATAIRAQLYKANGTTVGNEFLVNTITGDRQYDPSVTALANGGFVITWMDQSEAFGDQSGRAVRAQVFHADASPSGGEFLVNTITDDWQYDPDVTALADGRFVIVWSDLSESADDSSRVAVRAQVFNGNGTKDGNEFLVNSTTSNWQFDASVTALADGRFTVSWTDFSATGGDKSGAAIRGQIFDPRKAAVDLAGTAFDDDLVGTRFNDIMAGRIGDDDLLGGGGNDRLYGDGGDDVLHGGNGRDRLFGGRGADEMTGGNGRDRLVGGAGADMIWGDEGVDRLIGNAGDDDLNGGGEADILFGGSGSDLLKGGAGEDALNGGKGADYLNGGTGIDVLTGGNGNDVYVVNTAADMVIEGDQTGSGRDTVRSASIDLRLTDYANIENLKLTGGNDLNLEGNSMANKLIGNGGDNTIRGFAGIDNIKGLAGDDRLFGGPSADQITGGLGRDEMTGGGQSDIFIFDGAVQTGTTNISRDLIRDFTQAEGDLIDLSGIDAKPASGDQAFDFIGMSAFSSVKGQVRFRQTGVDTTRIQGDINGDGTADFEIELTGLVTLVAGDFLL